MDGNSTVSIFSRMTVPVLIVALHFGAMHVAGTPAALAQTASASADQPSEETWNSIKGDP
jgi:sulfur-oxidizing protein SoxY